MIVYYSGQHREIAELFDAAVHRTAAAWYAPEQLQAWSPRPLDYERWRWRCELKRPFVFLQESRVAGFIEFDPDGHIDCHYVHPDFNRQGIGGALLQHVLSIAEAQSLPRVYVEASHVAKELYLRHGFTSQRENVVARHGVELVNWIMERRLG